MWKNPHSLIKMTLEVVYPAVHKIKAESTAIQVEAKRLIQRVTPSSRSSRSSDHRRSRRHSPEYDRREGRVVSRRYTDDKDYSRPFRTAASWYIAHLHIRYKTIVNLVKIKNLRNYEYQLICNIAKMFLCTLHMPVFFSFMELSSGWKPLQHLDKMMSCWH